MSLGRDSVVQLFPSMYEVLDSNPSTITTRQSRKAVFRLAVVFKEEVLVAWTRRAVEKKTVRF